MKKIKKILPTLILLAMLILVIGLLTACKTSVTYLFNVDTGDRINVTLENKEYVLGQEGGVFFIDAKDNTDTDEHLCYGAFLMTGENYWKQTVDDVYDYANEDSIEVLQPSDYPHLNASSIIKYQYEDDYELIAKIENCDTGVQFYAYSEDALNAGVDNITLTLE